MKKIDVRNVDYIYLHEKDEKKRKILKHYSNHFHGDLELKTAQLQLDAHTALKYVSIYKNIPMKELLNDIIEQYIDDLDEEDRNNVIQAIEKAQKKMPND